MNTLVNFESALPQLAGQFSVGVNTLRKMLVDTALVAVVSLPAGVFNPYSGVKTSILFLDRRVHKQTDKVLFVKVQNDGFNLGAQRRAVVNSDLPEATRLLRGWMKAPEKLPKPPTTTTMKLSCRRRSSAAV